MMWNSPHKNILLMVFGVLMLAGLGALAYSSPRTTPEDRSGAPVPAAGEITVTGNVTCLPHRDEGGVHTLECAFGLKTEDGTYYALRDSDPNYQNIGNVSHDAKVEVRGIFTPGESDRYKSIGVIEVREIVADDAPKRATLAGTYLCLPHKDTSGPITHECAAGLKLDDGTYYAMDFMLMSQIPPVLKTGDRITASGVIIPIERISTDQWNKYPIKGIFSVTDSVKKL